MHDSHHTARKYHRETRGGGGLAERREEGWKAGKKDVCGDEEREKTAGV